MDSNGNPKIFISYSWDDEEHKNWVLYLVRRLFDSGIETSIDVFETQNSTINLYNMMLKNIKDKDHTILVLTENYADKADKLQGGVGFETNILIPYILENLQKIILIMRSKGEKAKTIPFYLRGVHYIDFSDDTQIDNSFNELVHRIYKVDLIQKPKLGERPNLKSRVIEYAKDIKDVDVSGTEIDDSINKLIDKFIYVYEEHGIGLHQMPAFIDSEFDIRFSDLTPRKNLLNKINDRLINWTCDKFGIQRRWIDEGDKHIYYSINCYKEVYNFIDVVAQIIDDVGIYNNYSSKIHVYALKDFKELKADKTEENGKVLFIIETKIGESSTDYIYKYTIIRDNLYWYYGKCRRDAKKIIAICNAFNIHIDGYDLPKDTLWRIGYVNLFPYRIINKLRGTTWNPEDYISPNDYVNEVENEDLQLILELITKYRKEIFQLLEKKKEKFRKSN
ncbi:toll/interleukin-1 receptor domain-containing protein [Clostridium estertheticum]|uniref:toll/interleukin-1 receptor domain-containing protein n=1 Tax=Clostridium estertheticum TaxID=238834 RepID=UPI001C7CE0A7|nr:toll/interleukin-1 receptor domain-containing protein [Clostridium estertheticum]MBX4258546.1 toll/interleukin-1 receptor domain-containing protein [Clostridium estertheticum]WLC69976.1 toll/interleukin-1 receptor domain-containing protein [Clostridium estertheticum]